MKRERKITRKKINSRNNFVYLNFKKAILDLKLIKSYWIFSFFLFLTITFIGAIFPIFFQEEIINLLKQIIEQTKDLGPFELTRFIIANNIQSSFIAVLFGIFFGIVPLLITIINAYVLGFVINQSISLEGLWIIWKLVPHGIFEIPAVLISVALGLRLGMFLFIYHGKNKRKEFLDELKNSFRIFVLIVIPLLVIAGIIEGILIWVVG